VSAVGRTALWRRCSRVLWPLALGLFVLLVAAGRAAPQPAPLASAAAARGEDDPVRKAQQLFAAGRYAEGRTLLVDATAERRREHVEYARLLMALCSFYERYVGDYRRVEGYLREIDNLTLAADNPDLLAAREARGRLAALKAAYPAEDAILARAASYPSDRQALQHQAQELAALIARRPEYPRLAAAHHYLGERYLRLEDYPQAYRSFGRALELRPAIDLSLPTERLQSEALEQWARRDLARGSRIALAGLLLLGAVLLARSKPWQWLGVRHALGLGVLLGAWWLCFRASVWLLGSSVVHRLSSLPPPVYLHTAVGTPMSAPLDALFGYGLVGVGGAFVIAVLTTRLAPRWTSIFGGGVAMLLLWSCLMLQLGLQQSSATFQPADQGRYRYLRGAFLYPLSSGQEPFILTDPTSYCGFQQTIESLDEPEIKRWFRQYAAPCRSP
jgi:tetratricopeptide (TPR) repeat protein